MIGDVNLIAILLMALAASLSPGPASLAIAGTSMARGRKDGLLLTAGVMAGSLAWSIAAALGLGAIMLAHSWVFEIIRYAGAGYLLFLAWKSARSALSRKDVVVNSINGTPTALVLRGLAIHITNPKSILFFGAMYSIGIPSNASAVELAIVVAAVGFQATLVYAGYALLFSAPSMTKIYLGLRRWFEGAFALGFSFASFKVVTARLQ
ncbi:threonine efflux protein [Tateyamaria omphalii]|uniref:LysE family translocator n=1 Tax=Tateyamaria omphalii TaxID=299262 RepID=UPI0016797B2E|nr:LysE family translocator [Tateyamaria omphalii]GGX71062.1 threonine efflux protein [Tateyamaria omphalii]